jgi:peroxiredoxin
MRAWNSSRISIQAFFVLALAVFLAQSNALAKDSFKPFKLKTLEGNQKSLEDYLGKATLVTFFFPTCGYCNAEFPHIQRFLTEYKDQGLSMVAINIMPDQTSLVADWQAKHQFTFPVLTGKKMEALAEDYDLKATPTNYLLDSKGNVLLKQAGYKAGDEKILEGKIREALNP